MFLCLNRGPLVRISGDPLLVVPCAQQAVDEAHRASPLTLGAAQLRGVLGVQLVKAEIALGKRLGARASVIQRGQLAAAAGAAARWA